MILELADIRIKPGQQAEFEEAIARGLQTVTPLASESQLRSLSGAPSLGRSLLHRQWLNILYSPTKVNRHLAYIRH